MKHTKFVICIENAGYPASLEKRKIYEALPDSSAAKTGRIRVIDESSEDYLCSAKYFIDAKLCKETQVAVVKAA